MFEENNNENPITSATENSITSATENPITSATENPITSATENPITSATENPINDVTNSASYEVDPNASQYRYDRSYYQGQQDGSYHGTQDGNMYQDTRTSSQTSYNAATEQKPKKEKKMTKAIGKVAKVAIFAIVVGLVGGGSFYGMTQLFSTGKGAEPIEIASTGTIQNKNDNVATVSSTTAVVTDISKVVEEAMPSVVSISNIGTQAYNSIFGQGTYDYESSGSGIIVGQSETELLIVTNKHVVSGANTINVTFIDENTYEASVKGSDGSYDIAILAIPISELSADTLSQIKVAVLGDSNNSQVGEPAIAIGNALGYGQSVTAGVISALNREVTVDNVTNNLIQTDAAINPGNSGGALLNIAGEVIGINSVKYASEEVEGMGYAIPISDVNSIIDELMNRATKEKVSDEEKAYLGIQCLDVDSSVAQSYNMPVGVYVAQVESGKAAEKAGIKKGDIITKIEDATISSYNELTQELDYYSAGTTVSIVVQSPMNSGYGYEEKTVQVTLDKKES